MSVRNNMMEEEKGAALADEDDHGRVMAVSTSSISEIEEEEEENSSVFEINHMESIREEIIMDMDGELEGSLFSVDHVVDEDYRNCVYVAVGKSESSVDAVSWTLKNDVKDDDIDASKLLIYLIHVFPEIHHIPSPLGKLPKSQVNPEQLESYKAEESGKRRELLKKFLNMCSASKVKVETLLVESDDVGKALLDLIPILNIRKLVIGATKSTLRKLKSKRGVGIADQLLQNAPQDCEIKIICDGKEQMIGMPSSPHHEKAKSLQHDPPSSNANDSFACMCFKSPRFM